MELADTSAWVWSRRADAQELRQSFDDLLEQNRIATCDMVRLELLYSARNGDEFAERREDLGALSDCPIGPDEWRRALDVYGELAAAGGAHQRSVKHPDLLIAAAAESAGVPVLHYDEDYERIAGVTGQAHRWLAPAGTLG
ncbi:MAG: PIN domain nuclease [Thermoleophilaceae bacterium]